MCGADFAGANAQSVFFLQDSSCSERIRSAFFDGSPSSHAESFISGTVVPALRAACPGKDIRITESGWPSRGGQIGAAVASINDERTALQGLNCAARGVTLYAFEYDDQLWKGNDNERSFGMWVKIQGFIDSC